MMGYCEDQNPPRGSLDYAKEKEEEGKNGERALSFSKSKFGGSRRANFPVQ